MGFQIRSLSFFPEKTPAETEVWLSHKRNVWLGSVEQFAMLSKISSFNKNYLRIWQKEKKKKEPWLKWTNYSFSGSISILIGCYFCHSSHYGIMTGPTAGNKYSLIPCPLGHNKLPFTCIQIKYTRLVRQGDIKTKMLLQNGLILPGDGTTVKGFCFSFYLIMVGKFFIWICF